jgi:ribonuclease Z
MLAVTFLGTSAARPTVERNVSAIALVREGETLLFDCGEGTQRQMMRYGVSFALKEIFFTHFHADHYLGVIGLVRTLGLQGREEPMTLFGPPGASRVLSRAIELGYERAPFPVEIKELEPGTRLERRGYDLEVYAVDHARGAVGYAVREHERLGRFDPARAEALGVPEGPLWGRIHRGERVVLPDGREVGSAELVGPSRPGRLVVLTGDTRPTASVVEVAKGADLLVHEATFTDDERDRAAETGHSTAREAAGVAKAAGALQLALVHVSARYSANPSGLLDEAREVFEKTVVAKDGMTMEVPFREG